MERNVSDRFRQYLICNKGLTQSSASSYISYLRKCGHDLLPSLDVDENLLMAICKKSVGESSVIAKVDMLKAYIIQLSKIREKGQDAGVRKKSSNTISALNAFSDFIIFSERSNELVDKKIVVKESCKSSNDSIVAFDGMQILFDKFDTVEDFVRFVISGCVFFQKEDVIKRFKEMSAMIAENEPLPARRSTRSCFYGKKLERKTQVVIFNDGNGNAINTMIDGNGNANVDKLIRDTTGYNLKGSQSRKPDMINLKISHIWGRAYHPSYFTSLWNIVLVPLFANDLLDKPSANSGDHFYGSLLLNTIKALIIKLYDLDKLDWDELKITERPSINEKIDVLHGVYGIKMFNKKDEKGISYLEITI